MPILYNTNNSTTTRKRPKSLDTRVFYDKATTIVFKKKGKGTRTCDTTTSDTFTQAQLN